MSTVIKEDPVKTLERYLYQIKDGELRGWVFIRKLDSLKQREIDGEPVLVPGIEVLNQNTTTDDFRYIASKLVSMARKVEEDQDKIDLGLYR